MQVYQYKLDVADARYETVKNGFKFERNGAKFSEVMNRETKKTYILAELADGKGGVKYDIMSFDNWAVIRHNADAIGGFCKSYTEGKAKREELAKQALTEQIKTLKGVGLVPVAIASALVAQGCDREEVKKAVEEAFKS